LGDRIDLLDIAKNQIRVLTLAVLHIPFGCGQGDKLIVTVSGAQRSAGQRIPASAAGGSPT
jgi:hypothetical protein